MTSYVIYFPETESYLTGRNSYSYAKTPDINKARVYGRKVDAANSLNAYQYPSKDVAALILPVAIVRNQLEDYSSSPRTFKDWLQSHPEGLKLYHKTIRDFKEETERHLRVAFKQGVEAPFEVADEFLDLGHTLILMAITSEVLKGLGGESDS